MTRAHPFFSVAGVSGLVLGLLLLGAAPAQAQLPSEIQETPLEIRLIDRDVLHATVPGAPVERLVRQAAALIRAREDGAISFDQYRRGIHSFRTHHPQFYGAFFGDPFYYDVRQQSLVRQRRLVSLKVEPRVGMNIESAFLCNPYGYDPKFGECFGFSYARSDFFTYPLFLRSFQPQRVRALPPVRLAVVDDDRERSQRAPRRDTTGQDEKPTSDRPDRVLQPDRLRRSVSATRTSRNESGTRAERQTTAQRVRDIRSLASEVRPAPEMPDRVRAEQRGLTDAEIRTRIREARDRLRALREGGSSREWTRPRSARSSARGRSTHDAARERTRRSTRTERARQERSRQSRARNHSTRSSSRGDRGSRSSGSRGSSPRESDRGGS